MKQSYQAYTTATQTVAKTRQIVLLYDGAIRFLQQTKEAIREGRIEDRYHLLLRASDIISGLQTCLDFEQGGDVARVLYQFYASIDNRLFSIHRNNSIADCDEIIADLRQMRDVWQDIDKHYIDGAIAASVSPQLPSAKPDSKTPYSPGDVSSVTVSA